MAMSLNPVISRILEMAESEVMMLLGVKDDLSRLKDKVLMINYYLKDAERKGYRNKLVAHWLNKLADVMYDADDILDECEAKAAKYMKLQQQSDSAHSVVRCCYPSHLSCYHKIASRHYIGNKIKGVDTRLKFIFDEKSSLSLEPLTGHEDEVHLRNNIPRTSPLYIESDVFGVEEDVTSLVSVLLDANKPKNAVLAIVGMGGIGKTTLARAIYNNELIKNYFDVKIWMYVSKDYSDVDLLRIIIRSAGGSYGESQKYEELSLLVREVIRDKKIFLVLDDVWVARIWVDVLQPHLHEGAAGNRILITTRNESLAREMHAIRIHNVNLLGPEHGWSMLCKIVFGDEGVEESVMDIGKNIVEKCGGVPLAIKSVAGVLAKKEVRRSEWEKVFNSEVWSSNEIPDGILPALYLSYQDLPSHLKQCIGYCSLFPKGVTLFRSILIKCWISEGFVSAISGMSLEESAEECYKELMNRCLFKIDPAYFDDTACTMHDLVRDLAILVANGAYYVQGGEITSMIKCRHISLVDDKDSLDAVMKHKSLRTIICFNPQLKSIPGNLFDKLRRLRVLDLSGTQIEALPCNIGNLTHLRLLDVSRTRLTELPESMDLLVNLQFLIVRGCKNLRDLPDAIVQLPKLRTLNLSFTPVSSMPLGIDKLKELRVLRGFVVTNEDNRSNMDELKSLSKLTDLSLHHLERAQSENHAKEVALGSKRHLTHLLLYCDNDVVDVNEEDNERIKQVFNELQPPPCIELLVINGFFGREVPTWLFPPYQSSLCNLRFLDLFNCKSIQQLPPLGLLPQLNTLSIVGASAVVSIGPEFLDGNGGGFPKLKFMKIRNMSNWEDWQLTRRPHDGQTPLLPHLKKLILVDCPKLKSIPECLLQHSTSMVFLRIEDAGSLGTLVNLSASVKEARIRGCPRLEAISNLQVQNLDLRNCPALKKVENLGPTKSLTLSGGLPSIIKIG
ncbi:putative disease resistance protein RGA3 [Acorus calamus]|uniref:Disease resistance protein RGA3 n=1 Tax=Acorus calamus TaxID=4465 RepID=A0AAV9C0P2_ACOCL|nr:putative disease resistance protein RGA3 [Acorus calamus]